MTTPIEPEVGEQQQEEPAADSVEAGNVVPLHTSADPAYQRRIVEALLFASSEPLSIKQIEECLSNIRQKFLYDNLSTILCRIDFGTNGGTRESQFVTANDLATKIDTVSSRFTIFVDIFAVDSHHWVWR